MPPAQGQKQGYCGSVALADGGNPEITNEFTATLSCVILKLQPAVSADVLDLLLSDFTEQSFSMKLDLAYQWQNVKQPLKYCLSSEFYRQGRRIGNVYPSTTA